MKKIIVAIDNKKILKKIKEINNLKIILKNVQYREAILEIIKKEKNIDFIFINEKLSGEISIEKLINKIKIINKKINIIFFLEKEDIKKENKLKKLGIKNIYVINKINLNKILNLLEENKNIKRINENLNNKKKYKIISVYGETKSGKSTIINLLIIYLIKRNKKILLINLSQKTEKNYLILPNEKKFKNEENTVLENSKKIKNVKKEEIKINKNLTIINNFEKNFKNLEEKNIGKRIKYLIKKYTNNYEFILFDFEYISNEKLKNKIIEESNKKIIVLNKSLLEIQKIIESIQNQESRKSNYNDNLHIIQNKYNFNSISYLLLKNIFKNFCNIHKILYSKNYINLNQKNLKNQNIKIKKSTKKIIEKILK